MKIKLAAIKRKDGVVFTGRNHGEIFGTRPKNDLDGSQQGFITDTNEFVGRAKAAVIAFAAEQTSKLERQLFSEDITGDWPWAKDVIAKLKAENKRLRKLLTQALEGMDYLGDILNKMDAVAPEDIEKTAPIFESIRAELEMTK